MPTTNHTSDHWINGARNWALWQDFPQDTWDAARTITEWHDQPSYATEHVHALLKAALLEKRLRHEADAATRDADYYQGRLEEIEHTMSTIVKKIN